MHPAYDGLSALPYYDDFDLSTVDILLISHFHIDHAASLPYVLAKTNFKGRVFMTHPTKAIYKWLIQDSVRVSNLSSGRQQPLLYSESDHLATFPQIEAIDYHTTHTISSVRITPYPAGHVLGAAMFLIEIGGLKILFTGDYSREEDRHLISASVPAGVKIDVLITESTYGVASHVPRLEREAALLKAITSILSRGGRVLMPVFALGRAQELLLILDEYWGRHAELQKVPIYYASNLARKCMVVYQTYVGAMNDNIKRLFRERMAEAERCVAAGDRVGRAAEGPWDFRYIRSLKNLDRFEDVGSCVMLASPGMLQNGVSRELLERWAPDGKNGVIITGYSVEGTMAKQIVAEPDHIPAIMTGRAGGGAGRGRGPHAGGSERERGTIPRRCSVQEFSFAAHVDGQENRDFIEEVAAPVVILVHGEQHNMMRLKSKLLSLNADKSAKDKVKVFSPKNCEQLHIPFRTEKTAKVVGKLADSSLARSPTTGVRDEGRLLAGVLVQKDFRLSLMAPEDLREYAGLTTTIITCKQRVRLAAAGLELIRWALESTFGAIELVSGGDGVEKMVTNGSDGHGPGPGDGGETKPMSATTTYRVMGCVVVRHQRQQGMADVEVEWEGNMFHDGIADAVMAVLLTVESSPAAVKHSSTSTSTSTSHSHSSPTRNLHAALDPHERLERVLFFLEAHFGAESITPILRPPPTATATTSTNEPEVEADAAASRELERLHRLGIPVPGIRIALDDDKHVATIWLETLRVECGPRPFRDRVQAVIDRAVETVAPLWMGAVDE
ncbi:MAG: endoribonuclease ysh1 [Phylliscum demangeonii]|nr:MAG: endoribonuclease ysh1 [Phylliscum demangeonii]